MPLALANRWFQLVVGVGRAIRGVGRAMRGVAMRALLGGGDGYLVGGLLGGDGDLQDTCLGTYLGGVDCGLV